MRGGLDLKGFKGIRRRKYGRKKKKKNQFFDCEVNEEAEERTQ